MEKVHPGGKGLSTPRTNNSKLNSKQGLYLLLSGQRFQRVAISRVRIARISCSDLLELRDLYFFCSGTGGFICSVINHSLVFGLFVCLSLFFLHIVHHIFHSEWETHSGYRFLWIRFHGIVIVLFRKCGRDILPPWQRL